MIVGLLVYVTVSILVLLGLCIAASAARDGSTASRNNHSWEG